MSTTGEQFYQTTVYEDKNHWYDLENLKVKDTNYARVTSTATAGACLLAGFDFSSIPSNATITGITFRCEARTHSSSGSTTNTTLTFRYVTDLVKGQSSYTDVGTGSITVATPLASSKTSYTISETQPSSVLLQWLNSNISKVKAGSDFGIRLYAKYARVYWVTLEIAYAVPYTITTAVSPSGSGTVTGGGSYTGGSSVTLTATPASGYQFVRWNDNTTNATKTITVSADASYTAYFEPIASPSKIYIGANQISSVYIGTAKSSAVYIGTTKVL